MSLPENITYLRRKSNISQTKMSEGLGVSQQTIASYENGKREPGIKMLISISKFFRVSIDELLLENLQPLNSIIARNLKFLREKNNYRQEDMAVLLGVSKSNMSKYENGLIEMNYKGLLNVSEFFGITVDQLLKEDLSKGEWK